jgi:hypothetical protein
MDDRDHIVGRTVLHVASEAGVDGFALQQDVGRVVNERVIPALEAVFDRHVGPDVVVRLDRVEVDAGRVDPERLEDDLATQIADALDAVLADRLRATNEATARQQAEKTPDSEADHRTDPDRRLVDLWHHVLVHGRLSWWAVPRDGDALDTDVRRVLRAHPAYRTETRDLLRRTPVARDRLVLQASADLLGDLLTAWLSPAQASDVDTLRAGLLSLAGRLGTAEFSAAEVRRAVQSAAVGAAVRPTPDTEVAPATLLRAALRRLGERTHTPPEALLRQIRDLDGESADVPAGKATRRVRDLAARLLREEEGGGDEASGEESAGAPGRDTTESDVGASDPEADRRPSGQDEFGGAEAGERTSAERQGAPSRDDASGKDDAASRDGEPSAERGPQSSPDTTESSEPGIIDSGNTESDKTETRGAESSEASTGAGADAGASKGESGPAAGERHEIEGDGDARAPSWPGSGDGAEGVHPGFAPEAEAHRPAFSLDDEDTGSEPAPGDEPLYVEHAGLVLLQPYLPSYFEQQGLLEGRAFADAIARERAVHHLHYLATGGSGAPEYRLVLEKLLAGVPLDRPVARDVTLTDEEREVAVALLRAAIRNWGALGAASPDGLREGFLQRDGKLERVFEGWRLCVEQRTIDILLSRLPWAFRTVKLPWMPQVLHVDWA